MPALPAPDPLPAGGRTYRALAAAFIALRRAGPLRALAEGDLRGYALALEYMLRAKAWLRRGGAPAWPAVQAAWAPFEHDVSQRDALAGTLQPCDRFELVAGGPEGFARRDALYAQAARSIDVASYYLQADDTGRDTLAAWSACVARGVRVRLLVDAYAMRKKALEVPGMHALVAAVRAAGVELQLWHDAARPFDSTHRKMIVVDGHTALVGGRNFANHYRGDDWRDLDLVLQGPAVAPLQALFDGVWHGTPRAAPPWVDHTGAGIASDPVMRFVLSAVGAARHTVELELAYFVAHDTLCAALARAAARGVRVRLLTNSAASNDLPYCVWTGYEGARRLLAAGAEVHARRGAGRTLHCKYVLVDREWLSFGSHNLDYYSPRFVAETNLVLRSVELGRALGAFFDSGIAAAEPQRADEVQGWLASHRAWRLYDLVFRDFQ